VLVENIVTAYDLEVVAGRILHEMERPFDIFGHTVNAGVSIGAAMAGPEHTSSDLLLRDADFAMYRAKQAGRGSYEIFDKHLEVCVTSQQERERELRTALDKRQFTFLYQPSTGSRPASSKASNLCSVCDAPTEPLRMSTACSQWLRTPASPLRWAGRHSKPCARSCVPGAINCQSRICSCRST